MNPNSSCCGPSTRDVAGHESISIPKTENSCALCEGYAKALAVKPIVVMSCEGACLRGEIARRVANLLCFELAREDTARLCLGGAFTKNTGQRSLAREAKRLISLEGCPIKCATRMMQGVLGGREAEAIVTDGLFEFDRNLFGLDEMSEEEIKTNAMIVAQKVVAMIRAEESGCRAAACTA